MAIDSETRPEPAGAEERSHSPFGLRAFVTAFIAVGLVVVLVILAAYHTCGFDGCPEIDQVAGFVPEEASIVVDRDGEEISKLFKVNRVVIGLDSLPEHVTQAFVATEDREFYDHSGVHWPRVLGAAWENLRSGGIEEGFSTISMQVARNVFPERLPAQQRTLNRKISEIKVARELEDRYSKDEILELYLNQIYFGSGAWGIQSAAREYFGIPATELSLSQAALLAGLPQAPSRLNPRNDMDAALDRRRTVLNRMEREGYITAAQAEEAAADEPELARSSLESSENAAYFVEHVRQIVEERLGDAVYTGGFTIHTTLDLEAQTVAERELREQIEAIESGRYGYFGHPTKAQAGDDAEASPGSSPYLQGAVMVMGVNSGDVLAMVGGRDFEASKFNRAIQAKRQPGSAFKPFVYAAALQAGIPPTQRLEDTPYRMVQDGRVWEPQNYGDSYSGEVTMREALVNSKNVATIRLAEQVGLSRVIGMARSLGISGDIPHYPSIAIGAAEVTLEEMVAAYAALATLGERPEPRYVTHVTDRTGAMVWQNPPRTRNVLSQDVAFLTVDLMQDVVNRGTGAAVRSVGFRGAAAGKTGTTNESADVWFVGFTPEVAAGVWIGMDDPQPIMARATGGRLAAPVWGRIMARVAGGSGGWEPPPGVEKMMVDEYGNVVASNCPTYGQVREEYFLSGTVRDYDCSDYRYRYGDSLYGDSLGYGDEEDSWWRRMRERIFGEDRDTSRVRQQDTIRMGNPPRDTLRPRLPDTIRLPVRVDTLDTDTMGRDTTPRDTIPRDTTPRDTGASAAGGGTGGGGASADGGAILLRMLGGG